LRSQKPKLTLGIPDAANAGRGSSPPVGVSGSSIPLRAPSPSAPPVRPGEPVGCVAAAAALRCAVIIAHTRRIMEHTTAVVTRPIEERMSG